ncbi:hypothetical protein AYI68_g5973 [Smittium mucronatum]|uniref:Uncharacterized protein n=1 Tax=Smittium mucronatum TaxID=133383 RepID=A0A1R0GSS3_9FUNG|nr:hypothetical protein AYI68_g5973 [Smittium mucronatum]
MKFSRKNKVIYSSSPLNSPSSSAPVLALSSPILICSSPASAFSPAAPSPIFSPRTVSSPLVLPPSVSSAVSSPSSDSDRVYTQEDLKGISDTIWDLAKYDLDKYYVRKEDALKREKELMEKYDQLEDQYIWLHDNMVELKDRINKFKSFYYESSSDSD